MVIPMSVPFSIPIPTTTSLDVKSIYVHSTSDCICVDCSISICIGMLPTVSAAKDPFFITIDVLPSSCPQWPKSSKQTDDLRILLVSLWPLCFV